MNFNKLTKFFALASLLLYTTPGHALEVGGFNFTGSGFLTLAAGTVFNNSAAENNSGFNCPCFVSNFSYGGIYKNSGLQVMPDSKIGLQGTVDYNNRYSLTAQVVARGADKGDIDLQWLFGSVRFNNNFTLQVGRKRLPLFYHSETQDVGFSYPWVHLPPQVYGWSIVNYNGVNLLYEDQWGDWASSVNVFYGNETVRDNSFGKVYDGKFSRSDTRWSDILGAYLSLSKDWFEARLLYIQTDRQEIVWDTREPRPPDQVFSDDNKNARKIYGLSVNIDFNQWLARSEFALTTTDGYFSEFAQFYGVGYRFGKLLTMVSFGHYRSDFEPVEAHSTTSLLLRYNLTATSDIKLQYDHWQNHSSAEFFSGEGQNRGFPNTALPQVAADLISVSYDMVF